MSESRPAGQDCPYCGSGMVVTQMACDRCDVSVQAVFPMARLGSLPVEHQRFIEMFVLAGGNLKEIAEQAGVSYPTIRSRLDKVIALLRDEIAKTRQVKGSVLDAVGTSGTSAGEAARLIKDI
jgi:hypothetical protein